jgi:hypothetical protein
MISINELYGGRYFKLATDEGFSRMKNYIIDCYIGFLETPAEDKPDCFQFKLIDVCNKLGVNLRSAQNRYIDYLTKAGFKIRKAGNGYYIVDDIEVPIDVDTLVATTDKKMLKDLFKDSVNGLANELQQDELEQEFKATIKQNKITNKLTILIDQNPKLARRVAKMLTIGAQNQSFEHWLKVVTERTANTQTLQAIQTKENTVVEITTTIKTL